MELLLTALVLTTLIAAVILIGTRGRPMVFFKAFGEFVAVLSANKGPLAIVGGSVVLTAAFLFFFYFPPAGNIGPAQPIPFSHRLHAGHKAINCRFCHPYVERPIHPGLPPVEKCLYCQSPGNSKGTPLFQHQHAHALGQGQLPGRARHVQPPAPFKKRDRMFQLPRENRNHGPHPVKPLLHGILPGLPSEEKRERWLLAGVS